MNRFATIKKPTEGCGPPAGVRLYRSRTSSSAVTASTNRQSISNWIRKRSQEEQKAHLVTLQSPFLVTILKTVTAASGSFRSLSRTHTRKGAIASVAAAILVPLCGCYNILLVNVGGVTKQASTIDHPLAPEVQCAALAQTGISGPITVEAMRVCEQAVATQKEIDALKEKKK